MPDQRFRILLVEDNPGDAFLVRTLLEETGEAFDVEHRSDLASAMTVLNSDGAEALFDVVLVCDHRLQVCARQACLIA